MRHRQQHTSHPQPEKLLILTLQVGVLGDVLDNAPNVTTKGRLGPGQMVMADLNTGTFKENTQIARDIATQAPYGEWLKRSMRYVFTAASSGSIVLLQVCDCLLCTWGPKH